MTAGLVLHFPSGVSEQDYDAVSEKIDFDARTGGGDWPAGLKSHTAGPTSDGGWIVTEVWESQEAQGAFMQSRLGPALADLPHPTVMWFDVIASQHTH